LPVNIAEIIPPPCFISTRITAAMCTMMRNIKKYEV
jgi:hypothetical protein